MKNILLIGTGHFGHHIAVQLAQLGHQVMAVDSREDRINEILPFVTSAQIGDATNKEFLRSLGVGNYDVCFVTIGGNFQNSLETTSLIKELGRCLCCLPRRAGCSGQVSAPQWRRPCRLSREANGQMGRDPLLYRSCF